MSRYVFGMLIAYALLIPAFLNAGDASFAMALQAPSAEHWFGTDHFGFDLFVRTAESLRTSLMIGAFSAVLATALGAVLGLIAATRGGLIDRILMRATDTVNAIPHLVLSVVIVAMFRGSLLAIVLAIACTHWTSVARIVRATVVDVRTSAYVEASYGAGASTWWVLRNHLAPAALGQCSVAIAMLMPHAVWHESALSFLGLGVQPEDPSLGTLLELARTDVTQGAWWTLVFPGVVLLATTVSGVGMIPLHRPQPRSEQLKSEKGTPEAVELCITKNDHILLPATTMRVLPGELHAVVGESGSGKSTLVRALLGRIPCGAEVAGKVTSPSRAGFVPQAASESFTPVRRVGPQLAEVIHAHRTSHTVAELLAQVHLPPEVGELFPHQLSGGMAQRVAIAAALAADPEYLFADEPTSALDPQLTAELLALFRELADRGLGVVIVSHDVEQLLPLADTVTRVGRKRCFAPKD